MITGTFHIAFATADIERATYFYSEILGCPRGRSSSAWVDFNFFGHQMSIHMVGQKVRKPRNYFNPSSHIPANHFGVILNWSDWHDMEKVLREARINWLVEPQVAFPGEVGEQKTMFIQDPDGNCIEFKTFADNNKIFATS